AWPDGPTPTTGTRALSLPRTLFVSYSGAFGGAERVLVDVAAALDGAIALACPGGELADRARDQRLPVIELPARPLELRDGWRTRLTAARSLAAHAAEIRRLARDLEPAVVVAWGARSALAAAPALTGASGSPALVVQLNDLVPGPSIGRALRMASRRASAVVVPSEAVARELGVPATVIPPAVDLDHFGAAPEASGPDRVLVLGAITEVKQPGLALEAAAIASRERPGLEVTFAGAPLAADGPRLLERLEQRAAEPDLAGRVRFAGQVSDPREALAQAACLLHAGSREAFGLGLVEALASGRPVIAPAAGGPLEIVDDSCGRLYRPDDPEAAARALVEVLGDPELRSRLGAAARERARERFDIRATRRRYADMLESVATAEPRGPDATGIALVTVTHNSEGDLPRLLDSAARHLPGARVVVVDSGSTDRSAELARERGATVIELDENAGFGRASNAGLREVSEPVTVLLNPDVELLDSSLALAADEVARDPQRILGPLVLLPDGERQDSAHAAPGSAAELLKALLPPAALPRPIRRRVEPWRSAGPRPAGWLVGCCLVARTDTLRSLGPFDDRLFLYAEDTDLGLRTRERGIEQWYWPGARVLHRAAQSSARAFGGEPFELLARQRRAVLAMRLGPAALRRDDIAQALTFTSRGALKTLLGRDASRERAQLRALRAARRRAPEPVASAEELRR
ncbi:MAG: glycosyltransferase, partial [Thermoleophilaceae bacterium]